MDQAAFYDAAPSLHYLFKTSRTVISGRPDPCVRFVSFKGSRLFMGARANRNSRIVLVVLARFAGGLESIVMALPNGKEVRALVELLGQAPSRIV